MALCCYSVCAYDGSALRSTFLFCFILGDCKRPPMTLCHESDNYCYSKLLEISLSFDLFALAIPDS